MRSSLAIILLCLLASAGCQRSSYNDVPDRGGHAFTQHAPANESGAGDSGLTDNGTPIPVGDPGPGEELITVAYGEALYQIADRYGVSLRWLIERNQLTRRAQAGDRLIVPARAN